MTKVFDLSRVDLDHIDEYDVVHHRYHQARVVQNAHSQLAQKEAPKLILLEFKLVLFGRAKVDVDQRAEHVDDQHEHDHLPGERPRQASVLVLREYAHVAQMGNQLATSQEAIIYKAKEIGQTKQVDDRVDQKAKNRLRLVRGLGRLAQRRGLLLQKQQKHQHRHAHDVGYVYYHRQQQRLIGIAWILRIHTAQRCAQESKEGIIEIIKNCK